jgi:hypothetical protein
VTIYDPFNTLISNAFFCVTISELFQSKKILISKTNIKYETHKNTVKIFKNNPLNNAKFLEEKIENIKYEEYDIIIFLISHNDSNFGLFERMVKDPKQKAYLPTTMSYLEDKIRSQLENRQIKMEAENFFTNKNDEFLPSLLFIFNSEASSLNGFPYSLLEIAEILYYFNLNPGKLKTLKI